MKKWAPLFFLCFAVLPLAAGLGYALLYSLGLTGAVAQGFSLEAWRNTLSDATFWFSMGLSAGIASLAVVLSTILALFLLLWLRPELERPRVRFLLHLPLAIPPIVAAFLSFQWLGSSGMLARIGYQVGWLDNSGDFPPLINDPWYVGVLVTMILGTFPFFLLIFLNHFRAADLSSFSDVAATLGASGRQIHSRIVAPVILRRAAPALLLYGVFLFGAYEVPLLLGRQNPAMISMFINQKFRRFNIADFPVAYVATVLYAILVMGVLLLFLRRDRSKARVLSA